MFSKLLREQQEAYRRSLELWKVQLWLLFGLHKLLLTWVHLAHVFH
jgi:hypothetical protein